GLSLAVVGLGERGRRWARLASMSRGVEILALVDPRVEVAKAARNALALDVPVFPSLQEAIRDGLPLEGAVVALPLGSREAALREALALRLHVLVEPPAAGSLPEVCSFLFRAEAKGLLLKQALWLRHSPPIRAMRRRLWERRLGAPIGGLMLCLHEPGREWEAVQPLSALLSLLGRAPQECMKERYALRLDFGEGLQFGLALGPSGDAMQGILVVCEGGALLWDGRGAFVREGRRGLRWRLEDPLGFKWPGSGEAPGGFLPLPPDPGPSGEEALLARFRTEAERGREQKEAVEEELLPLALLEACRLAQRTGKPHRPAELIEGPTEGGGHVEASKRIEEGAKGDRG
ncbi:MAG TPA: hypothetical protein EYP65_05055, partial [Armatimonadetes bacterium]|nr:hypothetical protein [Armatimonadota bacterium]